MSLDDYSEEERAEDSVLRPLQMHDATPPAVAPGTKSLQREVSSGFPRSFTKLNREIYRRSRPATAIPMG